MAQAVSFCSFTPLSVSLTLFLSISRSSLLFTLYKELTEWQHIMSFRAISHDDLLLSSFFSTDGVFFFNTRAFSFVWGVFSAVQTCAADRCGHSSSRERYITRTLLTWVESCHCSPEDTVGRMSPTAGTITVAHKVCADRTYLNLLTFSLSLPMAHPSHTAPYLYS